MYTNSMLKKVHRLGQVIYLLFIAIISIQRIRIYFPSIAFYFDMHILLPTVLFWGLKIIAYIFCLNVSVSCILWKNFRVIYLRQVSIKYVFTLAFILIFFRETKLFANYCFFTKQVCYTMLGTKFCTFTKYYHKFIYTVISNS